MRYLGALSRSARRSAALTLAALTLAIPSIAQQRPLTTQDAETIGAGRMLIEAGFDYGSDVFFPASGLRGDLTRVPLLGISVGIGPIAELQITGGPYSRLAIASRAPAPLAGMLNVPPDAASTSDVDDLVIGTKIRLLGETAHRPAISVRFATRLPNASNESGLGLDTTDFHAALLVAKTAGSVRFAGNLGLGILADPTSGDQQNDVVTYGFSLVRALGGGVDAVGELNGRANTRSGEPPVGTESRGAFRAGLRFTRGAGRFDAGVIVGLTSRDPSLGVTAGFTYVFRAFEMPD